MGILNTVLYLVLQRNGCSIFVKYSTYIGTSTVSMGCRHNFEKSYNPMTGEEEGGDISFPEFIDLVLNGHIDFADFLEEHGLSG